MISVKELISSIDVEDSPKEKAFENLMRKFELNEKIVDSYSDGFKRPTSKEEISISDYYQLAICLCLQAVKKNDIRYYNTALKISDIKDFRLPKIKF